MKIHLRRAYAGAYFPACYGNDPRKAMLPTTEDRDKVTCGRRQQMIFSERQYAAIAKLRTREE